MSKFWSTFRKTAWRIPFASKTSTFWRTIKPLKAVIATVCVGQTPRMALISFFPKKGAAQHYQNAYEVEKAISEIVTKSEQLVVDSKFTEAKDALVVALKIAEDTNVFSNISSVYDLLSTIAFKEGGITVAEDMLVQFIEKLIQLGYPEDHNSIVRFKLKLSRLYQSVGNHDMAELGYRDCINAQEKKIAKNTNPDELTNLIYISSLFWYGRLLTSTSEFPKAKQALKKALNTLTTVKSVSPAQTMVVLYYNAEVSYILKEYDDALIYLHEAISLCKESDPKNQDLPLYLIKVGYIYIVKGLYDDARFWCNSARTMARAFRNSEAGNEANLCIETMETIMKNPYLNSESETNRKKNSKKM